ncbi:dephospho-CoA kinase [Bacteroidia bacterium]|nr:dephospho-CoA kinase [Bacteroidia bacterium]GHT04554.1 dephospho-CoA kinase [Bacteroidia bacterium]GHT46107.1 dephospho-CoA kinase [Bacteroidia bacterium]
MKVLGITGGIGSGKSIVAKVLEVMGIPVYNTDIAAKKISDTSPAVREKLSARFGTALYQNGTLDRKMLASFIFSNPEHLAFANSVIHPAVEKDFLEWKVEHQEKAWVGIESAILFESLLNQLIDISMNVSAPLETRIQRIQKRDNLDRESILNRIKNQLPEEERNRLANYTIINDDRQALLPQIENLLKIVKSQ